MKIFIEKSKTDTYRERAWVYISRSHMCLVKHLEDYLRLVNINISSSQYIFRAISKCERSRLRRKNKPTVDARYLEHLLSRTFTILNFLAGPLNFSSNSRLKNIRYLELRCLELSLSRTNYLVP